MGLSKYAAQGIQKQDQDEQENTVEDEAKSERACVLLKLAIKLGFLISGKFIFISIQILTPKFQVRQCEEEGEWTVGILSSFH